MKVALGADHAGVNLKNELKSRLASRGHEVMDLGAHTIDPEDDYVDFAELVARAVADGRAARGILICGSGVGVSVAANKIAGVRAAICHDTYSARQGVEHDAMNVLVLGSRVIGVELAAELAMTFLAATFSDAPRHARRLGKIRRLDEPRRDDRPS
jgi:RpiB/LacA/LacB family sugar-phosphate isomerase